MGKKISWFDTSAESYLAWRDLCPPNYYRVVDPADLPAVVPDGLRRKAIAAVVAGSVSQNGQVYYVANVHRVEAHRLEIDQQPFALAFIGESPTASGCLLHHGKWPDRILRPSPEFWEAFRTSGLASRVPFVGVPTDRFGPIESLVPSQQGAFEKSIARMKGFIEAAPALPAASRLRRR